MPCAVPYLETARNVIVFSQLFGTRARRERFRLNLRPKFRRYSQVRSRSKALFMVTAAGCALALAPMATFAQHYTQTNLVSDLSNFNGQPVAVQDPTFKNSWGLARSASSPWWINNAGTGTSALYTGAGKVVSPPSPVVVPNAPGAKGNSSPTGIVFNGTTDFMIANVAGKHPRRLPSFSPPRTARSQHGIPPSLLFN